MRRGVRIENDVCSMKTKTAPYLPPLPPHPKTG
jgi:hypothetical protein